MEKDCKVISVSPLLRELVIAACKEPLDWETGGRGHQIVTLALGEIESSEALSLTLPLPRGKRLRKITDALRKQPNDAKTIQEWAQEAGASERTLARHFRKEPDLSFGQWRQQAQLTAALAALSTGKNVKQAASIAGFNSQSAFGSAFKQFFGLTPGQAKMGAEQS